jgi:5-hydroxyisourate hydrolase
MPGLLTTHVLDTARGRPAANLQLQLFRLEPSNDGRSLLKEVRTNADGRTNAPLLGEGELEGGVYEIVFDVGEYFAGGGTEVSGPPFLGRVPVRFGIADPSSHYHVPLLVSPWSYSTYRGS